MNTPLDPFALAALQAFCAALVLALLMGLRHATPAARWAVLGMAAAGLGLALRAGWGGRLSALIWLPSLALALQSAGLCALWWAISLWIRPLRRGAWLVVVPVVCGLWHQALPMQSVAAAVLADALLAAHLAVMAWTLSRPERLRVVQGLHPQRWRALALAAVMPMLLALLAHALVITQWPLALFSAELAVGLAAELALLLALPVLMLAWRGEVEADLARLARTDGVTGLMDLSAFEARALELFSVSRRFREPLALLVLDIDNFQALRAEHGEETAQRALALFASGLQTQMRLGDVIGRLSNDKFGVLLARCEPTGPAAMDARLRVDLAQRAPLELGFAISHSAGWARLRNGDRHLNDLLRRADLALNEARRAGHGQLKAEPGLSPLGQMAETPVRDSEQHDNPHES
ncbi:sensor domain-containing diguanylate cyclase [Roseateles paludis]|uniref:GGDEF domain-containing protein n=1 Tax=Roseateles paludis TaxID=3145238 RepID=A0ABV0G7F4_9BURK